MGGGGEGCEKTQRSEYQTTVVRRVDRTERKEAVRSPHRDNQSLIIRRGGGEVLLTGSITWSSSKYKNLYSGSKGSSPEMKGETETKNANPKRVGSRQEEKGRM